LGWGWWMRTNLKQPVSADAAMEWPKWTVDFGMRGSADQFGLRAYSWALFMGLTHHDYWLLGQQGRRFISTNNIATGMVCGLQVRFQSIQKIRFHLIIDH
jgi:hypothetical protein